MNGEMTDFMSYLFVEPFPGPWLVQDLIALILSLVLLVYIIKRNRHPVTTVLEVFAFVFFYASVYENAACVMGLYSYGRSFSMIGYVPAAAPLIEVCVLICGFWLLEKTAVPDWAKPPIIGLFGMLQDFSLDPLAIRQVFTSGGVTSARWNWLISATDVNILNVPVFNFPGWMLIMLYASSCLLVGRWWYRKSGYKPLVGAVYPFLTIFAALLLMISPISNLLLWFGPFFTKGSSIEWFMLAFHFIVPITLLAVFWRGRMTARITADDLPIFLIPTALHLSDIVFTLIGGYSEILWIVLLASAAQTAFLAYVYLQGKKAAA